MANDDILISISEEPDAILHVLDSYVGSAYNPQVSIGDIEGGHRLTVTYDDAEQGITSKSFDVLDGEKGETGDTGPVGPVGPRGEKGDIGEQGPQGEQGETGPQGERGVQGEKGEKGDKGDTGATGPQGPQGIQGETGPQGPTGATGADGFSPTVDVQPITGGHEVTITDATGDHSFDVMDGDPAQAGSITDEMLSPDGIKAQVKSMWGNRLTGELTGEVLTASDAYTSYPLEVGVQGTSEQASYTGAQLLDDSASTRGYRTNATGELVASSNCSASDYIAVDASTAYYYAHVIGSQSGYSVCEYDSNKEFVKFTNTYGGTDVSGTHTTGETTAYVRVSYLTSLAGSVMVSKGTTATSYEPYTGGKPSPSPDYPQEIASVVDPVLHVSDGTTDATVTLPVTLHGLPDGTRDTLALTYLRPSTREGWAWYGGDVTRRTGQTTQAVTDGITGTVGVDVISTTGEIADGPTVVYKLATPTTETPPEIELPVLPAPNVTIWATTDATPTLNVEYEKDVTIAYNDLLAAIADIATS